MGRKAMTVTLFVLLLIVCGAAPAVAAADKLKVVALEGIQLFPMEIMETKGIAKKHGIDVDLMRVASPTASYTVMQTGDFHIGFGGWLSIAVLRSKGFKLSNVYSMVGYTVEVMAKADSPLKSLAELKGKRVGLFGGPNAATTWLFRVVAVKLFDFDPTKDAKIHYGAPPLLIGMLDRGELDAVLILDPFITQLLETGKYRSIANPGNLWREKTGQQPMLVAVTVNEPWAKANPDVVKRFVAAYKEALTYLKTRPEVWPEIAKAMRVKTEKGARLLHERTADALITRWDKKFIEEQHAYAAELIKVFGESGDIPRQIPEGTFDMSYAR